MKRAKKTMDKETNSRAYKGARKQHLCTNEGKCPICSIHGGENKNCYGKHGAKKPKYKDKR
jgi:hypothetical protein